MHGFKRGKTKAPHRRSYKLRDGVVIFYRPADITGGTANGWLAKGRIPHTQHAELGGQAIQVQADAVEVGIGGASGQSRSHCILCCGILRHRLLGGVQQYGIDVGQLAKGPRPWRSVQLVQKQNAFSVLREKVRCCPL